MICEPVNDVDCLTKLSKLAAEGAQRESVRRLATRFQSTEDLIRHIRRLPQRDDDGSAGDAPTVACDVPQRADLESTAPNCVERSILYLAVGELIDPAPRRQLATIAIPWLGRHTFPVEDGEPVVLDPKVPRNALAAGLFLMDQARGAREEPLEPNELLEWVADTAAEEAARYRNGPCRMRRARNALAGLRAGMRMTRNDAADLGWMLALADRAAPMWGHTGVDGVERAGRVIKAMLRRNFSIRIAGLKIKPNWKALGKLGARLGSVAIKTGLASYGVPPSVVDVVEHEVRRELEGQAKDKPKATHAKLKAKPASPSVPPEGPPPEIVKLIASHPMWLTHPAMVSELAAAAAGRR